MTLTRHTIAALARELYDARKSRTPLRHFSQRFPQMTIADGYAIQRAWVALEMADGRTIKGRKIGLTSRAMQQSSQIDEPDFAPLMDDMFFAQGGDIPIPAASSRPVSRSNWPSSWAGRCRGRA
jgi:2-oxo-hept-3-ene-1,7-dioate hydratase